MAQINSSYRLIPKRLICNEVVEPPRTCKDESHGLYAPSMSLQDLCPCSIVSIICCPVTEASLTVVGKSADCWHDSAERT